MSFSRRLPCLYNRTIFAVLLLLPLGCAKLANKISSSTAGPVSNISMTMASTSQIGNCEPLQIDLVDTLGNLSAAATMTTAGLSKTGTLAGNFYTNADCSGAAITNIVFEVGEKTKFAYYHPPSLGSGSISATASYSEQTLSSSKTLQVNADTFNVNNYRISVFEERVTNNCYKWTVALTDATGISKTNTTGAAIPVTFGGDVRSFFGPQPPGFGITYNCDGTTVGTLTPSIPKLGTSVVLYWAFENGALEINAGVTAQVGSNPGYAVWINP